MLPGTAAVAEPPPPPGLDLWMQAAERLFCSLFLHSCCKELCTYTWVYTQTHTSFCTCVYIESLDEFGETGW